MEEKPTLLSKRYYLIVQEGRREKSCRSSEGDWIYTQSQHFMLAQRHLKGSRQPEGYYSAGYGSCAVNIRWLYTERNQFFAPEVTFSAKDGKTAWKLVAKIGKAFDEMPGWGDSFGPQRLQDELKATVVEYVEDGWRDYRPLRVFGEDPLLTLARAAD